MDKDIVDCSFCREPQLSCCFFFLSHESMIELCWLPSVALQEDQEVLMLLDFMNNIAKCFFFWFLFYLGFLVIRTLEFARG